MYDFVTYGINTSKPEKVGGSELKYDPFNIDFKALVSYKAGDPIIENPKLPNSRLLLSYGQVIKNSSNDCFSLTLSFSNRSEDSISKKRIDFFSKYFLFDQSHYDVM